MVSISHYKFVNYLFRAGSPNKDSPLIVVSDEKKSQSGSELKSPTTVKYAVIFVVHVGMLCIVS